MIFELMSRGNIIELPNDGSDEVTLLMPYGRYLTGNLASGIETWSLKKQGEIVGEEIFFYAGQPQNFNFGSHSITLSAAVVDELRTSLLSKSTPPGDHLSTVAALRGIVNDIDMSKKEIAAAYWGVRFALARGEHDVVSRIKMWYRLAPDTAFADAPVRVWFSLTQMPDSEILDAITALGFPRDDVQRVAAQGASPVVLFCRGYLLLASYGDGNSAPLFREWAYFPPDIWNELRERRRITLRELLTIAWGAQDAQNALKQSTVYGYKYCN